MKFRTFYGKGLLAIGLGLLALWGLTNSLAALSSASNFGVVAGLLGAFSSLSLPIWALFKLYKKEKTNAKAVDVGSTGGADRQS